MKETDYRGLIHFSSYFEDLKDNYVVVGGFATVILLDEHLPGHAKATHDIDLVLLTNSSEKMTKRIKSYISEGGYEIQKGQKDQYNYYRFLNPSAENFALEIELFASNEQKIELEEGQRIIPIDPEESLYSLSAIMLDAEYFEMIKSNIDNNGIAPCTNTIATIMLKMSAFYDLKERNDKKWRKHRADILNLTLILTGKEKLQLLGRMLKDFETFIEHINNEVDSKMIKGILKSTTSYNKDIFVDRLKEVFHK